MQDTIATRSQETKQAKLPTEDQAESDSLLPDEQGDEESEGVSPGRGPSLHEQSPYLPADLSSPEKQGGRDRQGEQSRPDVSWQCCPECGSENTITESGELRCSECETVLQQETVSALAPYWARRNEETEASRGIGNSQSEAYSADMVTQIGQEDEDAYGQRLSGRKRTRINRLRKLEKRIKTTSGEQRLQHGLDEVRRITNRVGAGRSFMTAACSRYKEAVDEELLDGRSIEGVAGAVVYVTLREWDMPRTMASVAAKVGVDETQFQRTLRYVMSELGILSVAPTARDFLPQFTSKLSLSGEGVDLTYELITVAEEANLGAGKDPAGMVGGAAYLASHLEGGDVTQEDAGNVANVTNVTIRNRAYDLLEAIGFDREGLTVRDISKKAVLQRLEGETGNGDCAGSEGAVAPATAD